jgi:transcriptional regulator with XRE-family HTH domain
VVTRKKKLPRDSKFEKSVGAKIKEFRKALGWSEQKLADYTNIERKQVQRLEKSDHSPELATLVAVAKTLGRQPYELLKTEVQVKVNTNLEADKKVKPGK